MPTGRADFWYGRPFMVTDVPDDGNSQDAPTANWAYNHAANSSAHHARYSDAEAVAAMGAIGNLNPLYHNRYSGGEAQDAMGVKANSNPFHHDRYADSEADARIALHTAVPAAHHAKTVSADIDHGGLQGLADDDHTQYLLASGQGFLSGSLVFAPGRMSFVDKFENVYRFWWFSSSAHGIALRIVNWTTDVTVLNLDDVGNLSLPGTVDGVDIAAHAANASAHHVKYTDAEAQAACWPTYIDRGDPSAMDYTTAAFTKDGTWRDLNLSAIVPDGAKAVLVRAYIQTTAAGLLFRLRKNGNVNIHASAIVITQAANVPVGGMMVAACDTSRVVEYAADAGTWDQLNVTICGWWK